MAELGGAVSPDDPALVAALRRGDETAFVELVQRYHATLVRVALNYVPNRATAEDVAQETWQGVVVGIGRFDGRSSLKTWLFRILMNRARTRGVRERRSIPFSALARPEIDADEPAVDPARFRPADDRLAPYHWLAPPREWDATPESRLLSGETRAVIDRAIGRLPPAQATVIAMRDIAGLSSADVCLALDISEANQRVLLHRARSKVRRALEEYLDERE